MTRPGLFLIVTLAFTNLAALSQTRRIVLLEEATNSSCGPCAANNPNLQAFVQSNFGGVVTVRYHAWWPGSTDPMYTANTPDNRNRIQYYGINGVPNYLLDGTNYGVPSDPTSMASLMWSRLNVSSPVKINVTATAAADSVRTLVTMIGIAPVTQTGLALRTAIIERMIVYTSPPGSNGETVFPDVMRKTLPNGDGIAIGSIGVGDTLRYYFSTPVSAGWKWQDLAVVSWLQSNTTKEVIQANINMPTYVMSTSGVLSQILQLNTMYTKHFALRNENPVPLHLRVTAVGSLAPAGWTYGLLHNGTPVDSIVTTVSPGDSLTFDLKVVTNSTPGSIKARVQAINADDPHGYGAAMEFFGVVLSGNVLFVDDDGGGTWENQFYTAFGDAGVNYTTIRESDLSSIAANIPPSAFRAVFWNVSWGFPALTPSDISFLKDYLDGGGNLFIAGQDIGWDIFDASGSSAFQGAKDFYHTYLGANYLGDDAGGTSMTGVPGDPIADGISFAIAQPYGSGANYVEDVGAYGGTAGAVILSYNNGKYGAVRNSTGIYKTVYLGVGLEHIAGPATRSQLVKKVLQWFGVATGVRPNESGVPLTFSLEQNYPNPFNPVTIITYTIAGSRENGVRSMETKLVVYDIVGREVATLVDEIQQPGVYSVPFDASTLASGVYFYRLTTGQYTASKRMVLIK